MSRTYRINYGRKTVKPFTIEDVNNMLVYCLKNKNSAIEHEDDKQTYLWYRNWLIIKLGINTAFRIEDLLQLKVDNIKGSYMYIREFKTGKEQSFELNPKLAQIIATYISDNKLVEGEYLFKSKIGVNKPITRQRARQIIKEIASVQKINYPVGCHSLRKCFARQFYEQTGDIIALKEMLNHSSERVTLLYICWDDERKNKNRQEFYL